MATSASRDTGSRSDCARLVRRLARRQEALRRQASRLEEEADALALDLAKLADDLDQAAFDTGGTAGVAGAGVGGVGGIGSGGGVGSGGTKVPPYVRSDDVRLTQERPDYIGPGAYGRRHTTAATRDALRRTAEAGVTALDVTRRFDGSADVRVDGGKLFVLPPTLADLLTILASNRGQPGDEEMVGWKSIDEITRLLEKKSGRPVTVHAVTQQIYRLRRELFERGGVNPWFVQTSRRAGARFALRIGCGAGDPPV